jgi:hypothetical protein
MLFRILRTFANLLKELVFSVGDIRLEQNAFQGSQEDIACGGWRDSSTIPPDTFDHQRLSREKSNQVEAI